ncbi:molybdate ABC transporter permease subunit [uncultured Neptuniibacter sp.]|uniref:molybdate ABC transporter permease subunit n=1 Tax=uncultured Neptuniibacter sp. TaxID=502143 RepID=UPI0026023FD1|nr:molybdate ABC transporter permease subunit [uncultured Neptuniibacter sp.]
MYLTEYEWSALLLSLKVSLTAIVISLPVAILVAWLLARKHFTGKSLLDGIVHLPLVLPPVVIGYLLLIGFGRQGWIGKPLFELTGFSFSFSWQGAALAAAVVAFPLMVRAIRQGIEAVDTRLELAARTLGASPLKVFLTITLPLTLPGILSGTVLGFARALGEFGATITFVSNIPEITRTIPLAMYAFIETPGAEAQAARLCIIAITIALISLLASEWLTRKTIRKLGGDHA